MSDSATVVVERFVPAPPAAVFGAWLDPQALARFMCACDGTFKAATATTDPRPGGRFSILMRVGEQELPHQGVYEIIDANTLLVFSWHSHIAGPGSRVRLTFKPNGANGTHLRLEHEGLDGRSAKEAHRGGWTSILESLAMLGFS